MRRFWTLLLTPVLAMAFFLAGSPAANAFGAEVLGCSWNSGPWIANNCGGDNAVVTFSAHNLSGTYTYSWSLTFGYSIISGCTATSSTCAVNTGNGGLHDRTLTASLTLTQSGRSRIITAQATVYASGDCLKC